MQRSDGGQSRCKAFWPPVLNRALNARNEIKPAICRLFLLDMGSRPINKSVRLASFKFSILDWTTNG